MALVAVCEPMVPALLQPLLDLVLLQMRSWFLKLKVMRQVSR
jgi:hypothetical protein